MTSTCRHSVPREEMHAHGKRGKVQKDWRRQNFLSSRLNLNASAVQILMIYDPFDVVRAAACTSVGISDYEGTLRLRFLPATRCVQFDDAYGSHSSRINTTFRQTILREISILIIFYLGEVEHISLMIRLGCSGFRRTHASTAATNEWWQPSNL